MRQAAAINPIKSENISLLVVDDNDLNRELIALQLKRHGYLVAEANSGYKALELLQTQRFDLVLLDIMMPGMSGIEVLEHIRKEHSMLNLPVIMVTADDLENSIVDALKRGANDYLIKPLNLSVTFARIKTQLALRNLAKLKDEFVKFASHDLKKPLIVTLDIVETLQKECSAGSLVNSEILELINLIHQTGENMQKVIEGFLNTEDFATKDPTLQFESTQFNAIVAKSINDNCSYAKKKQITLVSELAPGLPEIQANEFQIAQIIDNLLGNAIKFSPPHTETIIRTHTDGTFVYAEISDGGPGIPPAH